DQRLSDPPGNESLEPEQRDERVVELERAARNQIAAQDAPGEPPAGNAGDVEVLDVSRPEAGCLQQVGESGAFVAAVVAERAIDRAVERGQRGDQQHETAGWREQATNGVQRRDVVVDVL